LERARDEGFELGVGGKSPDEQKYQPVTPEGQAHLEGWNAGQDVHKAKFLELNAEQAEREATQAREKAEADAKKAKKAEEKAAKEVRQVSPETEAAEA
jgi:ribosome modulation factor